MKKKKDVDVENLNEVIVLSRKILKVAYIVVVLGIILLGLVLFTKLQLDSSGSFIYRIYNSVVT